MKPVKIDDVWTLTDITHEDNCGQCTRALTGAIAHARATGSVGSTYTLEYPQNTHRATVTREDTR